MFSDPAVWGPILVAIVVYFSASGITKMIHAANMDRMNDHRQLMEVLNCLPDELDNIKIALNDVAQNTQPEGEMLD